MYNDTPSLVMSNLEDLGQEKVLIQSLAQALDNDPDYVEARRLFPTPSFDYYYLEQIMQRRMATAVETPAVTSCQYTLNRFTKEKCGTNTVQGRNFCEGCLAKHNPTSNV